MCVRPPADNDAYCCGCVCCCDCLGLLRHVVSSITTAAVTSYGFASLESRLNQKAMKQEKTERSTKIISKLGGALSAAKSWFW